MAGVEGTTGTPGPIRVENPSASPDMPDGLHSGRKVRAADGRSILPDRTDESLGASIHSRKASHANSSTTLRQLQPSTRDDLFDDPAAVDESEKTPDDEDGVLDQLADLEEERLQEQPAERRKSGPGQPPLENDEEEPGTGAQPPIPDEESVQPDIDPLAADTSKGKAEPAAELAKIKSVEVESPDVAEEKKKFQSFFAKKLAFLDKIPKKKSIAAILTGGLLVLVGAGVAASPGAPAGICIYAVGIMLLAQGVANILTSGEDASAEPKPDPKPEPDPPKPDNPANKNDKEKQEENDPGQFLALDNPSYTGPDKSTVVDYSDGGQQTTESSTEDESEKKLKELASTPDASTAEIGQASEGMLSSVTQALSGASAERPLSQVLSLPLASACANAGLKADKPTLTAFSNLIDRLRGIAESELSDKVKAEKVQELIAEVATSPEIGPKVHDVLRALAGTANPDTKSGILDLAGAARAVSDSLSKVLNLIPSLSGQASTEKEKVSEKSEEMAETERKVKLKRRRPPPPPAEASAAKSEALEATYIEKIGDTQGRRRFLAFRSELLSKLVDLKIKGKDASSRQQEDARRIMLNSAVTVLTDPEFKAKEFKKLLITQVGKDCPAELKDDYIRVIEIIRTQALLLK